MTTEVEIHCINKSDGLNPHERIINVGGIRSDGVNWKLSQAAAIEGVNDLRWKFFVTRANRKVYVVVGLSQFGHAYLRTEPDGQSENNLLSLPECP